MKELYELMNKKKLTSFKSIYDFCSNKSPQEVTETTMEAFRITNNATHEDIPGSLFNFSASLTLSGGDYPCESVNCRLDRVGDLAKFASFYAQQTTIYNPFDFVYFFFHSKGKHQMPPHTFINEAINAFYIAFEYRSLIERELIIFSKTLYTICQNCKKKRDKIINSLNKSLDKIADKSVIPLIKERIEIEYGNKSFHLAGTQALIGEDTYIQYKQLPSFLIKQGGKIKNLEGLNKNHPLVGMLVNKAIDSLMFQKLGGLENLTQTYLTTNSLEKIFLEEMQQKTEDKALTLFAKGLPVIQNIPYEEAIKLRERYPNEFKSFQKRIAELIKNAQSFETQEEFDIYINAELKNDLKNLKKINTEGNRKLAFKGFAGGSLLGASVIISTLNNFDYPALATLAAAFYECADLGFKINEVQNQVQQSPVFFYYNLEKL